MDGRRRSRLLIVTECEHVRSASRVLAPAHFVKEIELWADLFESVELVTRFPPEAAEKSMVAYDSPNISFSTGNGAFSAGGRDRLASLGRSGLTLVRLARAFSRADYVHVRCPSRNGLLALLLERVYRKPCYVKWAGNWDARTADPATSRLQQRLIRSNPAPTVATVYQRLPGDPPHVRETLTSSLTEAELKACLAVQKTIGSDGAPRLLWVGRFSPNKNVRGLLDAFEQILSDHPGARLDLVGEGATRREAEARVSAAGLGDRVAFHGVLGWDALRDLYARAYLNLLPSYSEGLPKVVLEAMALGAPSVVFAVGAMPALVRDRGLAVSPVGDMRRFAAAARELIDNRREWRRLSENGRKWAGALSIESVVDGHRRLLEEAWDVTLM